MTYAVPHLRLVVSGTLYATDRFSWGLSLMRDFNSSAEAPATVPQGVIDAVVAMHTNTGASIASNARLDLIKLNEIGTNGRYLNQGETVLHEFETPVAGPGGHFQAPQIALAVTLGTAKRRGRAHSGRFYLPVPGAGGSTGMIDAGRQATIAAGALDMINDLEAALPGWAVAVMSDVGTGTQERVTHVKVGRVLDTIRSRRNAFTEEYVESAPVGGP